MHGGDWISMKAKIHEVMLNKRKTHRLILSRFPPIGVFDRVSTLEDVKAAILIERKTGGRQGVTIEVEAEQRLKNIPEGEWVLGRPNAHAIMAAFMYTSEGGGRFHTEKRGAWYCSFDIETALAEAIYQNKRRLDKSEGGPRSPRFQIREYTAGFQGKVEDIRGKKQTCPDIYNTKNYDASQEFAAKLLNKKSNGICYDSVRYQGGINLVIFKPSFVRNVIQGRHYEIQFRGDVEPTVTELRKFPLP